MTFVSKHEDQNGPNFEPRLLRPLHPLLGATFIIIILMVAIASSGLSRGGSNAGTFPAQEEERLIQLRGAREQARGGAREGRSVVADRWGLRRGAAIRSPARKGPEKSDPRPRADPGLSASRFSARDGTGSAAPGSERQRGGG